jgi:hypothetical protein
MRLFIAEKPDLAKAIVDGLGGGSRKDGYWWVCSGYPEYRQTYPDLKGRPRPDYKRTITGEVK